MSDREPVAPTVTAERDGPICTLTLNRPRSRNAINDDMALELRVALEGARADRDVSIVVLAGAGPAFCAGGDVRAMDARVAADPATIAESGWRRQRALHELLSMLHELEKVTIAAVHGPAMGLGCDLALCCDFVVAGPGARFAMSYVRRGLFPDGGGVHFLPRRVGLAKAKELIYSGREVGAEEAVSMGMADWLATSTPITVDVRKWAQQFVDRSSIAIALAKLALNETFERSLHTTLDSGSAAQAICYTSRDHQEAVRQFLDERATDRARKGASS